MTTQLTNEIREKILQVIDEKHGAYLMEILSELEDHYGIEEIREALSSLVKDGTLRMKDDDLEHDWEYLRRKPKAAGNTETKTWGQGTALRRVIHPEARIINQATGEVEYLASNETIDSYREIIRASGWRFDLFRKNAPFVDSHDYSSVDKLLGKVVGWRVEGDQLIERVQWAVGIGNPLADIGWKLTLGGFLKAVSVGFYPTKAVTRGDRTEWREQLAQLGLDEKTGISRIFLEQQQIELSAVVIGANPDAVARAYKADAISDQDLETVAKISIQSMTPATSATPAAEPADAATLARRVDEMASRILATIEKI